MISINVPLGVLGDNFLIKMTSKGIYDVHDVPHYIVIRTEILSPKPQGFFLHFKQKFGLERLILPFSLRRTVAAPGARKKT